MLAEQYRSDDDLPALEAGSAIRGGDLSMGQVEIIFDWKTKGRGRSRLLRNTPLDVEDALRLACDAASPRSAISVLVGLDGVAVPVASSIMTAIFPDRYTIIDFRALETLDRRDGDRSVGFYVEYLHYCRGLAAKWDMSLRQLDRALWQWSWKRSQL